MNGEELGTIFSCPGRAERLPEISRILTAGVRDHLVGFLRRRRAEVEPRSAGLVGLLERASEDPACWDVGLAFPWPIVVSSFAGEETDATLVAAKIAGHLHGCGYKSGWRAQLSRPRAVRIGRYLTPPITELTLEGDYLEYQLADGSRMRTTLGPDSGLRMLGEVVVDGDRRLWLADGQDQDAMQLDPDWPFTQMSVDHRVRELSAAVDFVRAHAPHYVPWFSESVRVIAAWIGADGVLKSGSLPGYQGLVYISSPLPVVRLAESLVHEASHQYFQTGETVHRFNHMAADERMYWSPYAGKQRHIDRILFAFHAFANVTAFYQCVRAETDDAELRAYADKTIAFHRPHLETFHGHLEASEELTAAGRALFRTVLARIQ